VVITVKDATKAAGTVVKDVAKSVDAVTIDVAKTVGDVATKATEMTANVVGSVQKTVSQATKKEEPKDDKPKT
jgi:chlorosome envelope protein C